ncbi:hypothetical protein GCM10011452_15570 [Gemmobacter lanyuensis]|uniref:Putative Flp pilus-assembly TadG-like N-terminal domain-containing protein n=1 Tax=Gemmobacter lanyuensis TaxID=1054497 RepID=A0A918MI32_9RHOB|nr:pilus assembly protein TadG-related protein [Gemmobacter lanyuensis]GGW27870.1 hypothetical protein GCM10011452_15570 [Gemmobacter lanyuensis]
MTMTRKTHVPLLRKFLQGEEGSMLPFSTMIFTSMMLIGGLAIDVMRHEQKRVMLQQTLDNSVLAAAALKQTLDPATVVRDYFDKASLTQYLTSVTVSRGLNFKNVTATAAADTKPFFMSMMGVQDFSVAADSQAEERISNVEVSLVLDVSGSMDGSRITALRPAARSFVDTIFNNSEAGKVTMSIVPYSTQVNVGRNVRDLFTGTTEKHDSSFCLELPGSVFSSTTLPLSSVLHQNAHFDGFIWSTSNYAAYKTPQIRNCNADARNEVVTLGDNATTLKSRITNLQVDGNTSIELGVKWGALLLDPSARGLVNGLISRNAVSSAYAGRPLDAVSGDTIKVLVVMTDGENTYDVSVTPPYDGTGLSPFYFTGTTSKTLATYYWPERTGTSDFYSVSTGTWSTTASGTRATWQQAFSYATAQYLAFVTQRARGSTAAAWYETYTDTVNATTKNTRLQQICAAAKSAGMVIFGIGFEAPTDGKAQLKACATDAGHYYDASSLDIATVFQSIATQISMLKLKQ